MGQDAVSDPLDALLGEMRLAVAADPALAAFAGAALAGPLRRRALVPETLPAAAQIAGQAAHASEATAPLARAIAEAVPALVWRQSYTAEEVGAEFLAGYAWANLVSPEGPFLSDEIRLSIGTWAAGLAYPRHWHAPEEMYLVIAGRAVFERDGAADRAVGPGDTAYHAPNEPHAARMQPGPLLAMAIWKGPALTRSPDLDGADAARRRS